MEEPSKDLRRLLTIKKVVQKTAGDKRMKTKIGDVIGYRITVKTELSTEVPLFVRGVVGGRTRYASEVQGGKMTVRMGITMARHHGSAFKVVRYLRNQDRTLDAWMAEDYILHLRNGLTSEECLLLLMHPDTERRRAGKKLNKKWITARDDLQASLARYFEILENWIQWHMYEEHLRIR